MPEGYLTVCEGVISSTGTPVIKKNTSNTDKRITKEKMVQESKKSWAPNENIVQNHLNIALLNVI